MAEKEAEVPPEELKRITFHYIKSNFFRVICVNGVWGGPTPSGDIRVSVFNERSPIPQQVTFDIKENGRLDKEIGRVTKEGIIREVEAELVMNLPAAEAFHTWLGQKIEKAKDLLTELQKKQVGK